MDTVKFGALLKELRKEKGLTQEQLAEKLGITNRTVSRWETGANLPDMDVLIELTEFYQVDMKALICGERKATEMQKEEKETLQIIVAYNSQKRIDKIQKVFAAVTGAVALVGLIYTALRLMDETIGGEILLLLWIFGFASYSAIMGSFGKKRRTEEKRLIWIGGFTAVILSNIAVFAFLFGTGSYRNFGLAGVYYILVTVFLAFVAAGVTVYILAKRYIKK